MAQDDYVSDVAAGNNFILALTHKGHLFGKGSALFPFIKDGLTSDRQEVDLPYEYNLPLFYSKFEAIFAA